MALKQTTDTDFKQDVIENSNITLVDFWAPWCGPCKQFSPVFEQASTDNEKVDFVKINIDDNPETPSTLGVKGIPTVIMFKDGEIVDVKSGFVAPADLQAWINEKA
ncbi:MAG: thioredoxin [Proteobacteria bacterium]|nr:thioredoxin [Pseudomonadota bacterium]